MSKPAWRKHVGLIDHDPGHAVVVDDTFAVLLNLTDVGDSEALHQTVITASLGKQHQT